MFGISDTALAILVGGIIQLATLLVTMWTHARVGAVETKVDGAASKQVETIDSLRRELELRRQMDSEKTQIASNLAQAAAVAASSSTRPAGQGRVGDTPL